MKIFIKVKTKAKKEEVKMAGNVFSVSVNEAPEKGKANEAVISALAKYFNIAKSKITIISGLTSRQKIAEIKD